MSHFTIGIYLFQARNKTLNYAKFSSFFAVNEPSTDDPLSLIRWAILNRTKIEATRSTTLATTTPSTTTEPPEPTETSSSEDRLYFRPSKISPSTPASHVTTTRRIRPTRPNGPHRPHRPPRPPHQRPRQPRTENIVLVPVYGIVPYDFGSVNYDDHDSITVEAAPQYVQYYPILGDYGLEFKFESDADPSAVEVIDLSQVDVVDVGEFGGKLIDFFRKFFVDNATNEVEDDEDMQEGNILNKLSSTIVEYYADDDGNPCVKELVEFEAKTYHRYTCELRTLSEEDEEK